MIESKGHKITPIDGDLAVSRNAEIGRDVDIQGKARVAGSLKVEGFLDAPNIKGVVKGLFLTETELNNEYPNPRPGWCAIVQNDDETGYLFKAKNRKWVQAGPAKPFEFIVDSVNVFASKKEIEDLERMLVEISNPLGLSTTIGIEDFIAFYIEDGVPHEIGIKQIRKDYGRISVYDATMNLAITVNGGSEGDNPTGVKEYWVKSFVNKTVDGVEKPFYAVYYVRVNWDVVKDVAFVSDNSQITERFALKPLPVALSVAGNSLLDMLQSMDYDVTEVTKYNADEQPEVLGVVWRDGTPATATYSDYNSDVLEYKKLTVKYNSYVSVVQEREFNELGDMTKRITIIKNA